MCKARKRPYAFVRTEDLDAQSDQSLMFVDTFHNNGFVSTLIRLSKWHITQQAHNVATTSLQRRCNVMTLQRRCNDVDGTLCVCWEDLYATLAERMYKSRSSSKMQDEETEATK